MVFKRHCNTCGKYYEGQGKLYCSRKCQPSWNKGLTKETDIRVKNNSENISIAWKNQSEEEKLIISKNISNRMFGDLNPSKRPEVRAKIGRKGERRSIKSEFKKGIQNNLKTPFKIGHKPWNKDKHGYFSEEVLEKFRTQEIPPGAGRGIGSWYYTPLQGYKFLRSTWELAYAEYLDQHNILWYYEVRAFRVSDCMLYTPDFYLPETNKFIEIKGYLDEEHKIKIEKFKQENSYHLNLLFYKDLIDLGINLKYYESKRPKKSNTHEISYESSLNLFNLE